MKRVQHPTPQKGQIEWEIFEEWAGKPWDYYDKLTFDPEEKITEFEYERFIPQQVLKTMDVNSPEFKNYIKMKNFTTKTKYERHQSFKKSFGPIMNLMSGLSEQEKVDFMHTIQNRPKLWQGLRDMVDKTLEKELSRLQEDESYLAKNRYRLDLETMNYADKHRMPVSKIKLEEALKKRERMTKTILNEVAHYEQERKFN